VTSADKIEIVLLKELFELLATKDPTTSTFILLPISHILIGVVPKKISDKSRIRNISRLGNLLDLFERMHVFREASVHAHNFFVDQGNERHVVKAVEECLPKCNFVSPFDFIKESIDSGNSLTFVVSPEYYDL
jgi:hypothetical protein